MHQSDLPLSPTYPLDLKNVGPQRLTAACIAKELRPYVDGEHAGCYVCLQFNPGFPTDGDAAEMISHVLVIKLEEIADWMLPGHLEVRPAEVRTDLAEQLLNGERGRSGGSPFPGSIDRLIFRPDGTTDFSFAPSVCSISPWPTEA